ncbi:DUF3040 domain-containing protein [Pseudonocardia sp. H11422]|uniref:DUF3040 domain-containing protein n=1 Tax=Pseudonocardia sp. H11422 TaxID=2835866 RepID=UPI001BDDC910|nr:DUF3040 domain-containing protein [Pseudonocardia sp. H11422]
MTPDGGDGGRLARIEHRLAAEDAELAAAFRRWRLPPDHDMDEAAAPGTTRVAPWVVVTLVVGCLGAVAGWLAALPAAILGGWWVYRVAHGRPLWPDAGRTDTAAVAGEPWQRFRP